MIAAFLSLIGGNGTGLVALGGIIAAIVGWMTLKLRRERKDGINEQIAAQSKQDKKNHELIIKDVNRAAEAGARVGTASGKRLQPDPYDRDNAG